MAADVLAAGGIVATALVWPAAALGKFDADRAVVGMELVYYGRLFVKLGNELEEASRATRRRRTFAGQNHGRA